MEKIAIGRVDLTTPVPIRLSGFGKVRQAKGVHDPVWARIFLFEGKEELLWITMDLLGMDEGMVQMLSKRTGIPADRIVISATHTHSAPVGTLLNTVPPFEGLEAVVGDYNSVYMEKIANEIVEKVNELKNELQPYQTRVIKGTIEGLGTNRHDPEMENDPDVMLLDFLLEDGRKAMICRMACHPTVLNQDNLLISADYPGTLEKGLPEYDTVAYVNGSCGDISTRFTRKANGFEELDRYGKLIADTLHGLIEGAGEYEQPSGIHNEQKWIALRKKQMPPVKEAEQKVKEAKENLERIKAEGGDPLAVRLASSVMEGLENDLMGARIAEKQNSQLEEFLDCVNLLDFHGQKIVTTPFELFCTLSNPLKARTGVEVVGYTNGLGTYLPDQGAYEQGYYESFSSPYAPGEGEVLMDRIEQWIESTKDQK